ncbi:MAG: adenylate/guanylate cyclase domain-containing protein [Leptospiraceae bacterium]|nr:adenylate/guanylate cyclase domain-containing protein [Leptospiraceae bacterium]
MPNDDAVQTDSSVARFIPAEFLELLEKTDLTTIEKGDFIEKEMALMFTDIRNFTGLSEGMTAADTFRFLNSYLSRMNPSIENYGGFVDKFIGDEIMALFPDAENALKAAIEMRIELRVYNSHRRNQGYAPIDTGMGLHFGRLMLGTVGSEKRLQMTVVGDTVNLASRIERLTKVFRTPFLLTDAVYKRLKNPESYLLRELDSVIVRGKKQPIVLYESFDFDPLPIQEKKSAYLAEYQVALFQYKAGNFSEARSLFAACAARCPEDNIPPLYLSRCDYLMENPPKRWTGISRIK